MIGQCKFCGRHGVRLDGYCNADGDDCARKDKLRAEAAGAVALDSGWIPWPAAGERVTISADGVTREARAELVTLPEARYSPPVIYYLTDAGHRDECRVFVMGYQDGRCFISTREGATPIRGSIFLALATIGDRTQ